MGVLAAHPDSEDEQTTAAGPPFQDDCPKVSNPPKPTASSEMEMSRQGKSRPVLEVPSTRQLPEAVLSFEAHETPVTAISIAHRGHRIATGDQHGAIRLWDFLAGDIFNGLRNTEKCESVSGAVNTIQWSLSGQSLLVASATPSASVLDLNLQRIQQTCVGDMYVRDSTNTNGHTHSILHAAWHPTTPSLFATSSLDGTVRLFDLRSKPVGLDQALANVLVCKTVNERGGTITRGSGVHSFCFMGPEEIAAVCADGSVQVWIVSVRGSRSRKPHKVIREFFEPQTNAIIHCSPYLPQKIFLRDEKRVIILDQGKWDPQQCSQFSVKGARTLLVQTIDFGRFLAVNETEKNSERISFYDLGAAEHGPISSVDTSLPFLSALEYHDGLHQLFFAGKTVVGALYDPRDSVGGLVEASRRSRAHGLRRDPRPEAVELIAPPAEASFSWYELPHNIKQMRDGTLKEVHTRRHQLRSEANPAIPLNVRLPPDDSIARKSAAQMVMRSFLAGQGEEMGSRGDPSSQAKQGQDRAAQTFGDISLIDSAYRLTQPEKIYRSDPQLTADEALLSGAQKCPRCGLKMCTCGYMRSKRFRDNF